MLNVDLDRNRCLGKIVEVIAATTKSPMIFCWRPICVNKDNLEQKVNEVYIMKK